MSIFGRTASCFTPGPASECSVAWVLEDSNPLLQNICRSQPPTTAGSWKLTSMEMPVMLTQPALPSVSEELVFCIMSSHRNCSHFIMFLIHGFCVFDFCVFDFCKILPSQKYHQLRILPVICLFQEIEWKVFSRLRRRKVLLELKINVEVKTIFSKKFYDCSLFSNSYRSVI